jgi:hypothetical protein
LAAAEVFITISMAKIILTVRTVNITVVTVTTAITKVTSVGSYATIVYYKRKIGMENGDKLVRFDRRLYLMQGI